MRISELAKKLGVKSADIIARLEKMKITGKKASSAIEQSLIPKMEADFSATKPTAKKSAAAKSTKKPAKKTEAEKPAKAKLSKAVDAKQKTEEFKKKEEEAKKAAEEAERKAGEEAERKAAEERKRKEEEELREIEGLIQEEEKQKKEAAAKTIFIDEAITVKELAEKLNSSVNQIIKNLFIKGTAVTVNQTIGVDLAKEMAAELGYTIKVRAEKEEAKKSETVVDESRLSVRPPIVTVMGHVDHGKTTLLDYIRKTAVAEKEAGGITQHIGATSVHVGGSSITFLDTPGHEAFTALRARGAQATDLVILVVAADDGVQPQTVEAVNHAKAANVTIIVAVNKIDKPGVNPDKVKQELSKYGLMPEEWGGDIIFCHISAKTGEGVDHLLEMVQLQAEVLELRADANRKATATVIESKLDKNRGPIHSIVIINGTLKVGDPFVMGTTYGKVRALISDKGDRVKSAGPSTAVELLGANGLCEPGEPVIVVESDRKARQISSQRQDEHRQKKMAKQHVRLENVVESLTEGEITDLHMVIKADTQGSVEAVKELLSKLGLDEVKLHVIHSGVGGITESDVTLADASDAIIIGFNVRPTEKAKALAEKTKIDLRLYNVIYEITDEVKASVKGLLKPTFEEKIVGRAEVRNIFRISRIGTIAGCIVTEGAMKRNGSARLIRDSVVIYTGALSSLKRFKDDAKEVQSGYECGICLEKFNDLKVGDIVEHFAIVEVER